jgi:antitoxin CptB
MALEALDVEGRRLLWRCRRGMKELDVLLDRFARGMLPAATSEQREVFARFLELPDPVLVDYLLGQSIPDEPELADLLGRIKSTALSTPAAQPQNPMAVVLPVRHDPATIELQGGCSTSSSNPPGST